MIVLDTNVVSALMQRERDARVVAWLDKQAVESVWTTSVTVFEIRLGLALLPPGRRRNGLEAAIGNVVADDLEGRILSFDVAAADVAGTMAAAAKRAGHNIDMRDVQIAGIVASREATLATRNVRHFTPLGLSLIDPWV